MKIIHRLDGGIEGHFAWISIDAIIGTGVHIGPGAWVGPMVTIGDGCVIGPGAVIGWDGFGYRRDPNGRWVLKHADYGVRIGTEVDIGPNTIIDRGSWRDTTIGNGTKIDGGVFIAHNVEIGRDCILVAHAEVSGSCVLEDGCWIGPSACVRQRLRIGARALVGMGAVVVNDVQPRTTVMGNPARLQEGTGGVRDDM